MEISNTDRIIVLVDMDCFYVQVEQKLQPEYQNKPCAVVQYNTWKGGGIIAVNYEARAKGVTRFLRGDEAQKACPDIHLFRVPEVRGKADLTRYRDAGVSVLDVLNTYSDCVERASIDEAYLDMTSIINSRIQTAPRVTADQLENTFVVGWEGDNPECKKEELQKWLHMIYKDEHLFKDQMLALAAVIVEEMRTAVYEKTGYRCSAGIAHNKMLAKLTCGIHKPNKQTVLPESSINLLFKTMPVKKVRNLGGKLGEAVTRRFNVENMGDLIDIPKCQFVNHFGEKTGHWLYNLVRGIDNEPVTSRQLPKSIGCGKNFPGKKSLSTRDDVIHWLKQLSTELEERLVKDQTANQRFARLLTVSLRTREADEFSFTSRSCSIHTYNAEKLAHDALLAISKLNTSSSDTLWKPSIWTLSMAASKFENKQDNQCDIQSYFSSKSSTSAEDIGGKDCVTESISSAIPKSIKTVDSLSNNDVTSTANKSIISFFRKKQLTKPESADNVETVYTCTDKNRDSKEVEALPPVSIGASSTCNITINNEVRDNKAEEISCTIEHSESTSSENLKPVGFFAKKLKERITCNPCDKLNIELADEEYETSEPVSSTSNTTLYSLDDDNEYSNLASELTKLCDECNKRIPIWEETEHADYHLALNLSKEFSNNSSSASNLPKAVKNVPSKPKSCRKRGSATKSSSQHKKPLVQSKTLDAFFK